MGHRLSKISTRTGDDGTTGLGDGTRVEKDDLRIQTLGDIDELNSVIGVLRAQVVNSNIQADEKQRAGHWADAMLERGFIHIPHGADYFRIIRGLPVISAGISMPIRVSMVGARSDSLPPSTAVASRPK